MGRIKDFFGGIGVMLFIVLVVAGISLSSIAVYKIATEGLQGGPASSIKNAFLSASVTTTVLSGTSAKQVLAANPNRQYALIQNVSGNTVTVCLGATTTCTSSTTGIRLLTNEWYEIDNSNLYTGIISATSTVTNSTLLINYK